MGQTRKKHCFHFDFDLEVGVTSSLSDTTSNGGPNVFGGLLNYREQIRSYREEQAKTLV